MSIVLVKTGTDSEALFPNATTQRWFIVLICDTYGLITHTCFARSQIRFVLTRTINVALIGPNIGWAKVPHMDLIPQNIFDNLKLLPLITVLKFHSNQNYVQDKNFLQYICWPNKWYQGTDILLSLRSELLLPMT